MKRIFITGNQEKKGCEEAAQLAAEIISKQAEVAGIDLNKKIELPMGHIDLVICLGGDGTFLNTARQVLARDLPIMGVNFGRLGFLTTGLAGELEHLITAFLAGETEIFSRTILEMEIDSQKKKAFAINDVVLTSLDLTRVYSLKVRLSKEMLFQLRGDGLIISTPTGSTAHSLSMGGTLMDPRVDAIQLTPMAPQSLSSRPVVVHPDEMIEVELLDESDKALVLADGRHISILQKGRTLKVKRAEKRIKVVQMKDFSFYQRLRDKLGWTILPAAE